ncbi:aldo/keto reductase [Acetobacter nitrogenifigens]|uniref:Oxidoreductase n=1 Tax=Acetobacter nitrogenifigens DSM 23921 = NBRC 105050 TaxID=1120919 RepID=A0A511X8S5_9PROT|nr:aldo/keto reductase [Acetobacter nitrogenifigens]GEN59338.1 oxidoreductase [Acetobacter nitrogenifigens DSM 23921 = NBRC 105050]
MVLSPTLRLSNGVEMPQFGLGTWPMDDAQAAGAVSHAIDAGYRLFDTAENYRNEAGVGEGVRRSSASRAEIFITTKFNKEWHSRDGVRTACEASLRRLGLDYVDLLLIHWPNPAQDRYVEAFEGMAQLLEAGLTRSIGVSNFKPAHLAKLFDAGFVPHVNQIQLDPYLRRDELVAIHREKGIVTETWSPLGRNGEIMHDPVIGEIAARMGRTVGQVILRWHLQSGFATTPKSVDPARQKENLGCVSFDLSNDDMARIDSLGRTDMLPVDADKSGH